MVEVGKMLFARVGEQCGYHISTVMAQRVLTKEMKRFGRIEGNSMERFPSCLLIPALLVI